MAKANLTYAHLAENVFPSEGGKLNVIGAFGGIGNPGSIGAQNFPIVYPRLALAVGLSTTETKLPVEVTFRDAKGKDIVNPFSGTFEIERPEGGQEAAAVSFNLNFDAFQITEAGPLYITIESGDNELAELTLNVVQAENQPPQTPPTAPPKPPAKK